MKPRLITYRLTVYGRDTEEPEFQVEAATPFPSVHVGELFKSEPVAGFSNETFHGKVGRVLHYMYAVSEEGFVCHTLIWLSESDWWETGEHAQPLSPH
jgi:hypothetical protein